MKRFGRSYARLWCGLASLTLVTTGVPTDAQDRPQDAQIRMAKEAWEMAAKEGWIEGIRRGDLIRPDLLSVTIDGGVVGALDPGNKAGVMALGDPADFQKPQAFSITSPTDPNYRKSVHPKDVGRASYEGRNCMNTKTMWPLYVHTIHWHDFFLYLPRPLQSGHAYFVTVETDEERDARFTYEWRLDYDEKTTTTKAIKINQVAYSAMAKRRYAYIGWWAGDRGKAEFSGLARFEVIDEQSGQSVHQGQIALRQSDDVNSGEDVYQLDISALKPRRYHVYVPGFACSESFQIGGAGIHALYYHTMRAFFHQRCGQEFKEPWTWVQKPACHTELWESGNFVAGPGAIHHAPGNQYEHSHYEPKPGEKQTSFRGGYHDAADFDTFTYHLPATAQVLTAYELYPKAFGDGDLDLPESGNGVPDVLDEAEWGLSFYIDHQYPNGAIPLGRINHCDSRQQNIQGDKQAPMPTFGLLPPMRLSTPTFAAVAAQFSRLIREYDAAKADRYLAAAKKAFDYAKDRGPEDVWREFTTAEVPLLKHEKREQDWIPHLTWAAGELLAATGETMYGDYFVEHRRETMHWSRRGIRWWAYLRCDKGSVDVALRDELITRLLEDADKLVAATEEAAYRMGNGRGTACGWGACQGVNHGDLLLRAYILTKDQKYLDAVCFNADWHLGANPLSKTLLTNMGYRHPRRPEISWFLYEEPDRDMSGNTVKGIAIYGIGPPLRLHTGERWPLWRSWRDVWNRFAEIYSEFTVPQTCGPAAILYATLYGMEKEAGLIPEDSKPDPLDR